MNIIEKITLTLRCEVCGYKWDITDWDAEPDEAYDEPCPKCGVGS